MLHNRTIAASGARSSGDDAGADVAIAEQATDYKEAARLATLAFGTPTVHFSPEHLQWFYERSFSLGSVVVALRSGDRKVGQFTLVKQSVRMNGIVESAVQLVDLFILKEFRSRARLQMLYDEVERQCRKANIRFAIGMPNARAVRTNEHFLKLMPWLWLEVRSGFAVRTASSASIESMPFDPARRNEIVAKLSRFETSLGDNGLEWDGKRLYDRLCGFKFKYGLHMSEHGLLISSSRIWRGFNYTLLCGFLSQTGVTLPQSEVRALVRAACRMWHHPLFVYAGLNTSLAVMPGVRIPGRLRPSLMLMQLRDFAPDKGPVRFDRYQLIDFDFA